MWLFGRVGRLALRARQPRAGRISPRRAAAPPTLRLRRASTYGARQSLVAGRRSEAVLYPAHASAAGSTERHARPRPLSPGSPRDRAGAGGGSVSDALPEPRHQDCAGVGAGTTSIVEGSTSSANVNARTRALPTSDWHLSPGSNRSWVLSPSAVALISKFGAGATRPRQPCNRWRLAPKRERSEIGCEPPRSARGWRARTPAGVPARRGEAAPREQALRSSGVPPCTARSSRPGSCRSARRRRSPGSQERGPFAARCSC